ncbi:FtsX-like permease family protein [Microbacterium sp. PMB16]|uniref:FtsX-like permease family protein n=1 Tax=Microbacterium sp. PMB16 TaxID=3120157 RepID=UPI003F4B26F1
MTMTVEAPETAPARSADRAPRPGLRSRWRVASLLARRQLRRTALSSSLIGVLIMLPIAAMTAYAIVGASMISTPQERVTAELGRMDAWIAVAGLPGSGFWQAPTDPTWTGFAADSTTASAGTPVSDPTELLPPGSEAIRVVEADVRVETPGGVTAMQAWSGQVWDPGFDGRYRVDEGRPPANGREVMTTPAALDRLEVEIGDRVVVSDTDTAYTVVGTLTDASLPGKVPALFFPDDAEIDGAVRWYLPEMSLTWPEVQELNEQGVVAFSRAVILNPPDVSVNTIQGSYQPDQGAMWTVLMVVVAGGLFAAYVVVMLAGAAFAVAARRQQRSLAIAASVGATAADLRRIVLLQGTTLGLAGGIAGLGLGIGAAALTMALLSDGSLTQFWGFHVPWLVLAGILVFSVVVGTASAAMPARTVARSDTLSALRGARRPQLPRSSRPIWGSILLLIGVALTIGCALAVLAVNATDLAVDSPLRVVPPFGIVVGPILVQLGILLSGRWLLWITSNALSRLGLAARMASRDAAANSSRTVPAFAAIAATVFIAVFSIGQTSMQNASTARDWAYQAPVGSLAISIYEGGMGVLDDADAAAGADAGVELAESAGASGTAVVARQPEFWSYTKSSEIPEDATKAIAVLPDRYLLDPEIQPSYTGQDRSNPLAMVSVADVDTALGVTLTPAQRTAYREGAAIVTDPRYVSDGTVDLAAWTGRDAFDGNMPDNIWIPWAGGPDRAEPLWEKKVEAISLDLPHQPFAVAISPDTAAALDIDSRPSLVIASFDAAASVDVRDRTQQQSESLSNDEWTIAPYFENGPPDDAFWMIPILSAVGVLVLGASGVALSLARFERRPDDATLSAVGGTNALRRRIGFWQGLIIAGFGTFAGAAAGVLPPIGFAIQSQGRLLIADMPWVVLALLAIALPLAIAVVSWLVPPRAAELTRRSAIA